MALGTGIVSRLCIPVFMYVFGRDACISSVRNLRTKRTLRRENWWTGAVFLVQSCVSRNFLPTKIVRGENEMRAGRVWIAVEGSFGDESSREEKKKEASEEEVEEMRGKN